LISIFELTGTLSTITLYRGYVFKKYRKFDEVCSSLLVQNYYFLYFFNFLSRTELLFRWYYKEW